MHFRKKDQMDSKMVDYKDSPYESEEQHGVGNSSNLAVTLRSLKEEIRSCKEDNYRIIQAQEKQANVNVILLQSLSDLQRQGSLQISHGHEDSTNGAYSSRSPSRHGSDRSNIVRDGRFLDAPYRRGDEYMYYFSYVSHRHHDRHRYHPYRSNDRGYLPDEFKKEKMPTFDGDMKKLEDAEAWILGMNKFFELHNYTDNMKAKVVIFSIKGKVDIWWEDFKWVRDIKTDDLSWREFKRLFRKKYLS